MSEAAQTRITKWLRMTTGTRGTIVRGVRFADETFISDVDTKEFPALQLEQAWRVVSDAFQVLSAQRFPPTRLTWVYDRAVLHCVRREDGAVLGVFLGRRNVDPDIVGLNRMLVEFLNMAAE